MRLPVLLLAMVASGYSSTTRVRDFFKSIREFATEGGQTASPDTSNSVIESALRYANSNGRDLDNIIDALTAVCRNNIGECDIEKLMWAALERLFDQTKAVVTTVESVSPQRKEENSPSRKRPMEYEADERRVKARSAESRERVEIVLRRASLVPRPPVLRNTLGSEVLNYLNYKLVEQGNFDQILYHLELLGATDEKNSLLHLMHVFGDAYKKLMDPSHELRDEKLEEALKAEEKFFSVPPSRQRILKKLRYICASSPKPYAPPIGILIEMEKRVFEMTKRGDLEGLRFVINLFENAGFGFVKNRSLFQRSLDLLERS